MTASTSRADATPQQGDPPLTESDDRATEMAYDEGRVPWFITVTWISFLALMVSYVVIYYVPDLRLWLELPPP